MEISLIFKIAAIGIIVAILNQVLIRSGRDEYAFLTVIAGIIVIAMMLMPNIDSLVSTVSSAFDL